MFDITVFRSDTTFILHSAFDSRVTINTNSQDCKNK